MLHIPGLYIAQDKQKGRGVYTAEKLTAGDLIEICPLIKIPERQLLLIDKTSFYHYYFIWDEIGYEACLALGYGSLYNHNNHPNAIAIMDYSDDTVKIEASLDILPGEEILIDYTGGTRGQVKLWFTPL